MKQWAWAGAQLLEAWPLGETWFTFEGVNGGFQRSEALGNILVLLVADLGTLAFDSSLLTEKPI